MPQRLLLLSNSRSHRVAPALIVAFLLANACRSQDERGTDSLAVSPGDAARTAPAQQYSQAQFRQLRWLEGQWRGRLPDGKYFYEQYRWADDSTIVMHAFADSTFARATDSARITLRNGVVANEGATARWEAAQLDSAAVHFAPVRGASNSFEWVRESANLWTATLHTTARDGQSQRTVYPMERMGRGGSGAR